MDEVHPTPKRYRVEAGDAQVVGGTAKLLRKLKRWCDQQRGRKAEIAKLLKIHPQAVSNLLAGRQQLTGEQALILQEFLDAAAGPETTT